MVACDPRPATRNLGPRRPLHSGDDVHAGNAVTENAPTCRACGGAGLAGDGLRCSACHGAWVAELSLLDLVADATFAPLGRLPWLGRAAAGFRACEQCAAPMQPLALYGIDLDGCSGHGIWLDRDELERVLREAPRHERPFIVPPPAAQRMAPESSERLSHIIVGDSSSHDAAQRDGLLGVLFKLFS
jgi:Zn-finger nucleic acid-binding protein